ncbi:MAG: endo-1,4-beta-xylanase [Hamadaea sp.]|nr:endo-1,4-beta-xylanase [Hamadaea sp.]
MLRNFFGKEITVTRSRLVVAAAATALAAAATSGLLAPIGAAGDEGGEGVVHAQPLEQPLRVLADRHDLAVGTAVDMAALADDADYRAAVIREFNSVTAENVMKWQLVEPERGVYDWAAADELVAFAEAHGQQVRGHTLLWHNQLPTWLTSGTFTPDEFRAIVRRHVYDEVGRYRGRIAQWDVVNEAFNEDGTLRDTIFLQMMGPGYIADVFRWAHEADPKAKLYYNDYNLEGLDAKSNAAYELVKELRAGGVPIHGLGIQGHLGVQYGFWDVTSMTRNLKRFTDLGVDVAFTEVDVRMLMPSDNVKAQAQAEGYSGLMQACLYNPRCVSFTVWGFTDKYSWVPGVFDGEGAANLLTETYGVKPAYHKIRMDLALATGRSHRG